MSLSESNKPVVFKKQLSLSSFLEGNTTHSGSINSDTDQKSAKPKHTIAGETSEPIMQNNNIDTNVKICKSLAYAPVRKQQSTKMLNPIFVDSSSEDDTDEENHPNCNNRSNDSVTRAIVHRYIFDDCSQSPLAPLENKKNTRSTENSIIKPISNGYSTYSPKIEKHSDIKDVHKNIRHEKADYKIDYMSTKPGKCKSVNENGTKEIDLGNLTNFGNNDKSISPKSVNIIDQKMKDMNFSTIIKGQEVATSETINNEKCQQMSINGQKKLGFGMSNDDDDDFSEFNDIGSIYEVISNHASKKSPSKNLLSPTGKENETVARKPKITIDTKLSDHLNMIEQDSTFKMCTKSVSKCSL